MKKKFLFGPVPSRRLGLSLGVDLGLNRQCSLDCVYCEVGKTKTHSMQRDYFAYEDLIIKELEDYLKTNPKLDYITFSGTGEPTLSKSLGNIIRWIKANYSQYKIAVLTNTTTLVYDDVKNSLMLADLILPSLDSVVKSSFEKINRPADGVDINKIVDALVDFCQNYKGKVWVEVFIIEGVNDSKEDLTQLKDVLLKINPDEAQLNSLDRPGTESWVKPASKQRLTQIKEFLQPVNAVLIGKFSSDKQNKGDFKQVEDSILDLLDIRPATLNDLQKGLGLHVNLLNKHLRILQQQNKISTKTLERGVFYIINK